MNIPLPDSLKAFADEQVSRRGCGTTRGYVRVLRVLHPKNCQG